MIDFAKDYVLENEKVLLRPLKEADFELLLEFAINEPEIWKFNARGANSADSLKRYIETALANREKHSEYPFIVYSKADRKFVGSTRFYLINTLNKTLELGFTWYGQNYQGTGINKNCKYLLLEFAFEVLGMERVGFRANNQNEKSIHAMKSIGCKVEGVMRNYSEDADGNRIDAIVLSILNDEWFGGVKDRLKEKIETAY